MSSVNFYLCINTLAKMSISCVTLEGKMSVSLFECEKSRMSRSQLKIMGVSTSQCHFYPCRALRRRELPIVQLAVICSCFIRNILLYLSNVPQLKIAPLYHSIHLVFHQYRSVKNDSQIPNTTGCFKITATNGKTGY